MLRLALDEVARLDATSEELTQKSQGADTLRAEAQNTHNDLAQEVVEATRWLAAIREEKSATERAIARLEQEAAQLKTEAEATTQDAADVEALEAERNKLLALAASKASDVEQARRTVAEAAERETQAKARLEHAQAELAAAQEADDARKTRLGNVEEERKQHQTALKEAQHEETQARDKHAEITQTLERKQAHRAELRASVQHLHEEARKWSETIRTLEDAAYRDDIARARAETKRTAALQRLLEEYNIDETDAQRQAPLVQLPPEAQKTAQRLRREIKDLGEVNIGAIEAFEALTERHETLERERQDILDSKAELDKAVAELDKLTRGAFAETFEKVNQALQETFQELLGGGEANLELTDPHNILETGVDINVRVPGKKTQRLELLSGGERALAACAFLFALLKVKPSPLCVLDELDAPLDGRNVERYVEMLKARSQHAQFIVITHNPTTIEAAPTWFGVTMQEPGVSTVIPYRVPEQAKSGEAHEPSLSEAVTA